jgi:hypothetical protein
MDGTINVANCFVYSERASEYVATFSISLTPGSEIIGPV